jgi:hypothetical protein
MRQGVCLDELLMSYKDTALVVPALPRRDLHRDRSSELHQNTVQLLTH